jgi:hypothetical protein
MEVANRSEKFRYISELSVRIDLFQVGLRQARDSTSLLEKHEHQMQH